MGKNTRNLSAFEFVKNFNKVVSNLSNYLWPFCVENIQDVTH
jgi:hypothetical protein